MRTGERQAMEPRFLSPVLNGRTAELSALMSILDRALAGRGQAVLVAGEAGIGKSRLAAEMSARAANLGFTILQGSCFEHDRSLPYGPLQDMLRSHFPQLTEQQLAEELGPAASELLALVPELHVQLPGFVALPTLDPEQDRRRLFHALGQYLLDREPCYWSSRTSTGATARRSTFSSTSPERYPAAPPYCCSRIAAMKPRPNWSSSWLKWTAAG